MPIIILIALQLFVLCVNANSIVNANIIVNTVNAKMEVRPYLVNPSPRRA